MGEVEGLRDGGDDAAVLRAEGRQAVDLGTAAALDTPLSHLLHALAARVQQGRGVDALQDPPSRGLHRGRMQEGAQKLSI